MRRALKMIGKGVLVAEMTDEELRAIFAYLKTLPAKGEKHKAQL